MAVPAPIVVTAALLENDDAIAANVAHDLGGDGCTVEKGAAHLDAGIAGNQQHLAEFYHVARRAVQLLDADEVVGGDAVLLAAGLHDCVHFSSFLSSRRSAPLVQADFEFVVVVEALGSDCAKPCGVPRGVAL